MRRTVKVSFIPCPRRPITTPEKIWMRSLSPSTTLVWTRTVSPTPNSAAFLRYCSDSILSSIAWFIKSQNLQQVWPAFARSEPSLLSAPAGDLRVVARKQYIRHFHAAKIRWPRVLRILQQSMTKRLFQGAFFIAQNARQEPSHCVDNDHYRQRAIREHVITDRQFIIGQLLPHTLIEAFIMARDQKQLL